MPNSPVLVLSPGRDIPSHMDTKTPVSEASSELARELLIAISQSSLETLLNSKAAFKDVNFDGTAEISKERAEELRSKLISISNVPEPAPVLPANCSP
ncbi:hypothetical protein AKJ16_DCAP26584 [Drosera capensis]